MVYDMPNAERSSRIATPTEVTRRNSDEKAAERPHSVDKSARVCASFPLMRSWVKSVVIVDLGHAGPQAGTAARLVLDVRGRRHLTTHVHWTASDSTGKVLASEPACVEPRVDERVQPAWG